MWSHKVLVVPMRLFNLKADALYAFEFLGRKIDNKTTEASPDPSVRIDPVGSSRHTLGTNLPPLGM